MVAKVVNYDNIFLGQCRKKFNLCNIFYIFLIIFLSAC